MDNQPSTSTGIYRSAHRTPVSNLSKPIISPAQFRGYPKAGPRKNQIKKRKKGKSIIATDTPEKAELEEQHKKKQKPNNKKYLLFVLRRRYKRTMFR